MTSGFFQGASQWVLGVLLLVPGLGWSSAVRGQDLSGATAPGMGNRRGIRLLSMGEAPVILGQPRTQGAVVDLAATLEVYAEGTSPLGYTWFKDGAALPPATNITVVTNATLAFQPFTTNDVGAYHVVVSNAYGAATSEPATLTALPNPSITQQPEGQTVVEGDAVAISILAQGSAPLYYYWYKDGVYDTNISLSTGTLLFQPVAATDAGAYQIIVSNAVGVAASAVAVLVVKPNTPRQLRTLALEFPQADQVVVPVEFAAQGDEQNLSFSLHFDPAVWQLESVALTDEAAAWLPSGQLTVNDLEAAQGRIGLSVALAPAELMPTQTFRLADLSFLALGPDWAQAGLAFDSTPVPLATSGTNEVALPVLDSVSPILLPGPVAAQADAQSGLFTQTLRVVNPGALQVTGYEVLVHGLTQDSLGRAIRLANASGQTNNVPLVYYRPLPAGSRTDLTLSYYVADRRTLPTPTFEPRVVPARQFVAPPGQVFTITSVRYADNRVIVEFETLAGRTYYVEYVEAIGSTAWRTALPAVVGTGSRVQWIDDGPPNTASRPTSATNRFYRGVLAP